MLTFAVLLSLIKALLIFVTLAGQIKIAGAVLRCVVAVLQGNRRTSNEI